MLQNHSHPSISILAGACTTITAYIVDHQGLLIENIFGVIKLIIFGIIGGASGYIGKLIVLAINKKIKNRKIS